MITVEVEKAEWMASCGSYVIFLKETQGERTYFVYVDELESQMIELLLDQKYFLPRKATSIVEHILERVEVTLLRVDIFRQTRSDVLAKISFHQNGKLTKMITRPACAIELAVRCDLPLRIQESLLSGDETCDRESPAEEVTQLKDALEQAVRSEDYEEAALLRDRIFKLEKKEGQRHDQPRKT